MNIQARTQDFEKGGSEYRVALGHGEGDEGVGEGAPAKSAKLLHALWMI